MDPSHAEHLRLCHLLAEDRGWFSLDEFMHFMPEGLKSPTSLLTIMESFKRGGWLVPDDEAPGIYRPVSACSPPPVDPGLHEQIAEYFIGRGEQPGTIAHHLHRAGAGCRAVPFWRAAVKDAFLGGDIPWGMEAIDLCFASVPDIPGEHEETFLETFMDLYDSTQLFRSYPRMEVLVRRLLRICHRRRGDEMVLMALACSLSSLVWQGRFATVQVTLDLFFRKSRGVSDPRLRTVRRAILGVAYYLKGRILDAVRVFDALGGETEELPRDAVLLEFYLAVAHTYALSGRISRALGLLDAIRDHAHLHGMRGVEGWTLGTLALVLIETGSFSRAREVFDELTALPGWEEHLLSRNAVLWGRACLDYARGNFPGMREHLDELLFADNCQRSISGYYTPSAVEIGVACLHLGEGRIARYGLERFARLCRRRLRRDGVSPVVAATAAGYEALHDFLSSGEAAPTLEILERSARTLDGLGCTLVAAKFAVIRATLLHERGRAREAQDCLREYDEVLRHVGEDLFGGYLRDLLQPEAPERLLLRALSSTGQALGTLGERDVYIQRALETLARLTHAERSALFMRRDGDSHRLVLRASQGITEEYVLSDVFAPMRSWLQEMVSCREGRIRHVDHVHPLLPRSALCVPLIIRDQVAGVLYQDNRIMGDAFDVHDLELVQALGALIAAAVENARIYGEIDRLNRQLVEKTTFYEEENLHKYISDEVVARSRAMCAVLSLSAKVARTTSTVLITGETGVGKELVASTLHRNSPRSKRAFVKVNCAALPEHLIESELFGHERGAFTGAAATRIGRFELADGGTIFLDEIGELPVALQAKLLRVLQEGEFERLGSQVSRRVEVRIIAATNRDLTSAVDRGEFRADLFYRLNVFPIHIPPLRQRRDDIPVLACHFLARTAKKLGKPFAGIVQADMRRLCVYAWPGNIRELRHVIERSAILSAPDRFHVFLPEHFPETPETGGEIVSMREMERRYILRVLDHTGGKIAGSDGAAALLGLKRTTLISRMQRLGIARRSPAVEI